MWCIMVRIIFTSKTFFAPAETSIPRFSWDFWSISRFLSMPRREEPQHLISIVIYFYSNIMISTWPFLAKKYMLQVILRSHYLFMCATFLWKPIYHQVIIKKINFISFDLFCEKSVKINCNLTTYRFCYCFFIS